MKRLLCLSLLCGVLGWAVPAHAEDDAAILTGRKVLKENQNAVISVSAVLKINVEMEGGGNAPPEERQQATLATIVDSTGLAVTSLSGLDPTTALGTLRRNIQGQVRVFHLKGELRDVKYRLSDGTEIPARVVRTDDDLDLAYLGPQVPLDGDAKAKIAVVSLNNPAKDAELLDTLIFLGRLDKTFNFQPALSITHMTAKLTKPRTEYISGGIVGCPCFLADGRVLGIVLAHHRKNGSNENDGGGNVQIQNTPVVIPVADITESLELAKEDLKKPSTAPAATSTPTSATGPVEEAPPEPAPAKK